MKENLMSREVAVMELNKWYDELGVPEDLRCDVDLDDDTEMDELEELSGDDDYKKERSERIRKREKDDVMRERVIRSFMNGSLIRNDDNILTYKLKEPVTKKDSGEVVIDSLTFKKRYHHFELEAQMKGVKPDEFMVMTRAYIATLTGVSKSILGRMLNRDMEIAQAVYQLFSRGES